MQKLLLTSLLGTGLCLQSCFESSNLKFSGVIITTNTAAKIKIYNPGQPEKALDSVLTQNGKAQLNIPEGTGPWAIWADNDSSAALTLNSLNEDFTLELQSTHFVKFDTALIHHSGALRGYAGSYSPLNGAYILPVVRQTLEQPWHSSSIQAHVHFNQGDTALLSWNQQDALIPSLDLQSALQLLTSGGSRSPLSSSNPISSSAQNSLSGSSSSNSTPPTQFIDPRDQHTYPLVKIGSRTWFAENMRYSPVGTQSNCPNNDNSLCQSLGRLYPFNEAKQVCPVGTHLADTAAVTELFNNCGDYNTRGSNLKGGTLWARGAVNNSCGFNAMPTGYGKTSTTPTNFQIDSYFWLSDTTVGSTMAQVFYTHTDIIGAFTSAYSKDYTMSVRCILD